MLLYKPHFHELHVKDLACLHVHFLSVEKWSQQISETDFRDWKKNTGYLFSTFCTYQSKIVTGTQNERCGSYVFMNCINYWDWTEIPSIVLGMEENLKYCSVLHLKRYYLDGFPFNRVFFAFQNTDNEVTFGPMKLKQKNLSVSNPLDYFWEGGGLEGDISGWIL